MKIVLKNYILLDEQENINLLEIRNHADMRRNMLSQDIILLENHLSWLNLLKESETSFYYAVCIDDELFGGIYITGIDYKKSIASWGVFFKSGINPLIPSITTFLLIDRIFNTLNIKTLNLEVNKLNINAYNFDLNFGFKVYDELEDGDNSYHLMTMNKEYWNNNKNIGLPRVIEKRIKKIEYKFI